MRQSNHLSRNQQICSRAPLILNSGMGRLFFFSFLTPLSFLLSQAVDGKKQLAEQPPMNGHNCAVSRSLLTSDPLMKQMHFPDTNYGKQNKQKQTLKPIIIRLLTQTRWREAGAYQLLEVITKLQTIFRPSAFLCTKVYGFSGPTSNVLIHTHDS